MSVQLFQNGRASKKVALTWSPSEEELAMVKNALPRIEVVHLPRDEFALTPWGSPPEPIHALLETYPDVEAVMGWARLPLWALKPAVNLRFISWLHAGVDELDLPALASHGIQVANVRGANGSVVAEHAMALLLGLAKRLIPNDAHLRAATWPGWWDENAITELKGSTVCIVGFGNIGKRLAPLCAGFGMKVLAVNRTGRRDGMQGAGVTEVGGQDALPNFLGRAQFVVLALPLTRETHGIVDGKFLSQMPRGAFLINVARGDLVQEDPLADALLAGHLAGFASDVWWNYEDKWPPGFPKVSRRGVHHMPNVLCTGDAAADLLVTHDRMIELGLENLQQYFAGQRPKRFVDPQLGY